MPTDSSKHLEAFNSEQTKSVEAIRLHSPNSVDLELAKDIGLISTETREKIEESLPDHNVLFQSALLSQRGSSEASFRRAFESIYGKFLFESNTKVPDEAKKRLNKVLKHEIDDEIGLEDRSELMAAIRRLLAIKSSRKGDKKVQESIEALESKKGELSSKLEEANEKKGKLEGVQTKANALDKSGEVNTLLAELKEAEEKKIENEEALKALATEKAKRKEKLDSINLDECKENALEVKYSLQRLNSLLPEPSEEISSFIEKIERQSAFISADHETFLKFESDGHEDWDQFLVKFKIACEQNLLDPKTQESLRKALNFDTLGIANFNPEAIAKLDAVKLEHEDILKTQELLNENDINSEKLENHEKLKEELPQKKEELRRLKGGGLSSEKTQEYGETIKSIDDLEREILKDENSINQLNSNVEGLGGFEKIAKNINDVESYDFESQEVKYNHALKILNDPKNEAYSQERHVAIGVLNTMIDTHSNTLNDYKKSVEDYHFTREKIRWREAELETSTATYQEKKENIKSKLAELKTPVETVKNADDSQLINGLSARCSTYLTSYQELESKTDDELNYKAFEDFVNDNYNTFLSDTQNSTQNSVNLQNNLLQSLNSQMGEVTSELHNLNTYKKSENSDIDAVLEKAFPKADKKIIRQKKGEIGGLEKAIKKLEAAQEYFSSDDDKKINSAEIERFEQGLDDYQRAQRSRSESLEAELTASNSDLESAKTKLAEAESRSESSEENLNKSSSDLESAKTELEQANEKHGTAKAELAENLEKSSSDLETAKTELEEANGKYGTAKTELAEAKTRLDETTYTKETDDSLANNSLLVLLDKRKKEKKEEAEHNFETAKKSSEKAEKEQKKAQEKVKELERQNSEYEEKLEKAKKEQKEAQEKVEKLERQNSEHEKKLEEAKKEQKEAKEKVEELEHQNIGYKKEIRESAKDIRNIELGSRITELEDFIASLGSILPSPNKESSTSLKDQDIIMTKKLRAVRELENLKQHQKEATELHEKSLKFLKHFNDSGDLDQITVKKELYERLTAIKPERANFQLSQLSDVLTQIKKLHGNIDLETLNTEFDTEITKIENEVEVKSSELSRLEKAAKENSNLTDSQAAKKIIAAIAELNDPNMTKGERDRLATLVLTNDIETIQTQRSYRELASRPSAERFDALQQVEFKEKLINFQYKEGDKVVKPFKGFKPENFDNWSSIERLFNSGRLDHKNGFFVMSALNRFNYGTESIQSIRTAKKLKELLAKELGVEDRMDESGINKIVNDAFEEQLKKSKHLVDDYFNHYDENKVEWNQSKVKELNKRHEVLNEKYRNNKISKDQYNRELDKVIEETNESGLINKVDFSQNTLLANFWNNPASQWLRDRGHDVGKHSAKKVKAVGLGALKTAAHGLWGTTKLGLSLGYQTAVAPLRAVKYPLMLAAKPLVGFINLFRKPSNKWKPITGIRETIKKDAGRFTQYFSEKGSSTFKGATEKTAGSFKSEWAKDQYKSTKYADRSKISTDDLNKEIEEFAKDSEATPVEVSSSPLIDLDKYKKEVEKLNTIISSNSEKKAA